MCIRDRVLSGSNNLGILAMLYRMNKEFTIALGIYIKLISQTIEAMTTNPPKFNVLKDNFIKYLNGALRVAYESTIENEPTNSMWYTILDCIYDKLVQLHANKSSSRSRPVITGFLTSQIEYLISEISQYVTPSEILKQLKKGHGELEIGPYRSIISSLFLICSYQLSLAKSALIISSKNSLRQLNNYYTASTQGYFIKKDLCHECKGLIVKDADGEIIAFACGHAYHAECMEDYSGCKSCVDVFEVFGNESKASVYGEDMGGRVVKVVNEEGMAKSCMTSVVTFNKEKVKKLRKLEVFERMRSNPYKLFNND
eukprot:TRINITY_DN7606_c0_g1_i2.p1 TRINITY_DN7606_c0_g1~~TRINITY_DN7606_c0_g1_i2.p1  ORF type:complete len:313 (+),score=64.02 TRINITY_DN7606_c0_g1_i2:79-1017(+)